jgi:hypothetical protein
MIPIDGGHPLHLNTCQHRRSDRSFGRRENLNAGNWTAMQIEDLFVSS